MPVRNPRPDTNPAGSNTQIQYNDNNTFGANSGFTIESEDTAGNGNRINLDVTVAGYGNFYGSSVLNVLGLQSSSKINLGYVTDETYFNFFRSGSSLFIQEGSDEFMEFIHSDILPVGYPAIYSRKRHGFLDGLNVTVGTEADPIIRFWNPTTDTGFFCPNWRELAVTINGTEALRWNLDRSMTINSAFTFL